MSLPKLSRRGFLKGAAIGAGALAGTRLAGGGTLIGNAMAAGEPSHLVHIVFPGGYNALFGGCADKYLGNGAFGVAQANVKALGGGVFTDAGTIGTLPAFALSHFAAVGMRHGVTSHLDRGAERAILFDGTNSYLTQLATAMGGTSPLKAVHFGDRMPYGPQPAFQGTSLQRIQDLKSVIASLGQASTPDPTVPDRALAAGGLGAASEMSQLQMDTNKTSLLSVGDGYRAAIDTLKTPVPPTPPVTFADISTAYGLNGATAVNTFTSMIAGAEIMIRAAGSNVINICDPGFVLWDFHQVSGGQSLNGTYSRSKFTRSIITPLKTFLNRMLNLPDRNVVVVLSGDFVRIPTGDHGDGTVTSVMGKYVKNTVSFPCDGNSRFAAGTPGVKQFWAGVGSALKVATPFGASPHAITL
ncbi:MAG: hypothetical protein JWM74_195 [Myxococcaceae bacterium]|jgi:hypothetical protein|nr:hypothetical protein [Myxococcaceae bacterium]